MDDDLIDLESQSKEEHRNAFGALDKLVVNAAMIAACLIPTMVVGLITPWKLLPMITGEEATGRRGLILGPGIFFLVAIMATVFLAGAVHSGSQAEIAIEQQETQEKAPSFFGTRDSVAVARAVANGEFSQAVFAITPLFLLTVLSATLSKTARPLLDKRWTLEASLRAWLYYIGTAISLTFIMIAFAEFLATKGDTQLKASGDLPMLFYLLYFFTSLFKGGFTTSWWRAAGAAGACLVSFMVLLLTILAVIRF